MLNVFNTEKTKYKLNIVKTYFLSEKIILIRILKL